jgi:hypothetical protein
MYFIRHIRLYNFCIRRPIILSPHPHVIVTCSLPYIHYNPYGNVIISVLNKCSRSGRQKAVLLGSSTFLVLLARNIASLFPLLHMHCVGCP